jgi:hypothetical protein
MNFSTAILFAILLGIVGLTLYGVFSRRRFFWIGLMAIVVFLLSALGSWYSWMESQSVPWTLGYGAIAIAGAVAAFRHLRPRSPER